MGKRFDKIFESVVSRFSCGGYLTGDLVQFRSSYKSTDCYKSMNSAMQKEIEELIKSGLNIRVVQVGDKLSGASAGNQHKSADMVVITVAADQGGGRYYNSYTVTPNMIDLVDQSDFTPKIPEKFYHNSDISGKPVELKTDHQNITRLTDKGDGKNTPNKLNESYGTQMTKDNAQIALLFENLYNEGVDDAEKYRLITAIRHAQKSANPSALKIATTNLQAWAKQTNGAYQDPEVLEFIEPQQQQAQPAATPTPAATQTPVNPTPVTPTTTPQTPTTQSAQASIDRLTNDGYVKTKVVTSNHPNESWVQSASPQNPVTMMTRSGRGMGSRTEVGVNSDGTVVVGDAGSNQSFNTADEYLQWKLTNDPSEQISTQPQNTQQGKITESYSTQVTKDNAQMALLF